MQSEQLKETRRLRNKLIRRLKADIARLKEELARVRGENVNKQEIIDHLNENIVYTQNMKLQKLYSDLASRDAKIAELAARINGLEEYKKEQFKFGENCCKKIASLEKEVGELKDSERERDSLMDDIIKSEEK